MNGVFPPTSIAPHWAFVKWFVANLFNQYGCGGLDTLFGQKSFVPPPFSFLPLNASAVRRKAQGGKLRILFAFVWVNQVDVYLRGKNWSAQGFKLVIQVWTLHNKDFFTTSITYLSSVAPAEVFLPLFSPSEVFFGSFPLSESEV